MPPPLFPERLDTICRPNRLYVLCDMRERRFVECGLRLSHGGSKVDNPLVGRTLNDIHAHNSRFQDIGVRAPVRIGRKPQPFSSRIARNIECSVLVDPPKTR